MKDPLAKIKVLRATLDKIMSETAKAITTTVAAENALYYAKVFKKNLNNISEAAYKALERTAK